MLESCLFKSSTCTALEVDRRPFGVPFLFHPCGSHPGGCDTSLAKRQDTKWSADDFGHNLGVAASGKKLPKDLANQRQVFSCDTRKNMLKKNCCVVGFKEVQLRLNLTFWIPHSNASKVGGFQKAIKFQNNTLMNKRTTKNGSLSHWIKMFLASLISLNRMLGWLGLCIPVWHWPLWS